MSEHLQLSGPTGPGSPPAARPGRISSLVANTPADRNRVVDLVRVTALAAVVFGHWIKQGLYVDPDGTLHRAGLLGQAPWTHPLTWAFQVMPLFFLVGGYANAKSWRHSQARGETYGEWLGGRMRRLTRPLLPLLGFWAVAGPLSGHVGLGDDWLHVGSDTSLLATWFLAAYVVVVVTVPLTHAAWTRWGGATIVGGLAAAALTDLVSISTDSFAVGALNLLFVWGTLHQLGYLWLDRAAPGRRATACLGLGCLVVLAALVRWGPYGVSMVGVSGFGLNNTYPPRVTILLLGAAQVAAVLLLEPVLARAASSARLWPIVVAVETRTMTIYLWHLTALVILAAGSLHLGGLGLRPAPASADWWLLRPAWFAVLAVVTTTLVVGLGRWEDPVARPVAHAGATLPLIEAGVTSVALAIMAADGLGAADAGPRWPIAVAAFTALGVLAWWDRRTGRSAQAQVRAGTTAT